jgi:hypothetical protein
MNVGCIRPLFGTIRTTDNGDTIWKSEYFKPLGLLEKLIKQEVLGRTNRILSLIHGPHCKRRLQQFFYCSVCIRYRVNVSTEPLPSNDTGTFTERSRAAIRGDTWTHTHTDNNVIS